jgi:KipI family sensor histidine kinase inhibitor
MYPRILNLGDAALTVEFGDRIDPALVARVAALDQLCRDEIAAGRLSGVIETVPTFRALAVIFDPLAVRRATLVPRLAALAAAAQAASAPAPRQWRLPVHYGGAHGPDLDALARAAQLTVDEVVALHAGTEYRVYMLGFLPGFPFMGDVPEPLRQPRRSAPRVAVPAGSVAVAAGLTAIYPWPSPGGWHLVGHCPVPLFDAARPEPALLRAGDRVRFTVVAADAAAALAADFAAGRRAPDQCLAGREAS